MAYQINPSYFGPAVMHTSYDLTSMVYQVDGARRNLPNKVFEIRTPLGVRVFVSYRDAIFGG